MSDCWVRKPVWAGVEWKSPDGRRIYLSEDEVPCTVSVVFKDGTQRDLHIALAGREVSLVTVDGVPYTPRDADESWEMEGGRVTAITFGGTRYSEDAGCEMTLEYRGVPCSDYRCSSCGKVNCAPTAPQHCSRCGARVERVVDAEGRELRVDGGRAR